jgi:hypothetical protein
MWLYRRAGCAFGECVVKNSEISALIARVESGASLGREETLDVLRQFLQANRSLIKARDAGFVVERKKARPAKERPGR